MGLRISSFKLERFRNHEVFSLPDVGDLTIFIGRNGIGKTNVLEAIDLLASTTSFRHARTDQLIASGHDMATVRMDVGDSNRQLAFALNLEAGKKSYSINGKAKSASSVRGILPAISFTPDDLELAKKSSSLKRDALDLLGSQLSANYHVVVRDYAKALRYKNRLLKDEAPRTLVEALDETLVVCASQLFCYRLSLFEKVMKHAQAYYREISQTDERFAASYLASWEVDSRINAELSAAEPVTGPTIRKREDVKEALFEAFAQHADEERARKRSVIGPHNDKIRFFLGGRDVSDFASQGQQRSIVLAWKLAEVELVCDTLGVKPVLLLDDVMSELDDFRRNMLVKAVGHDIQTFITATDLAPFNEELLSRAKIVDMEHYSL